MPQPTKESNLIRLIKSLKQGEKRYVTQHLSKHKKENNLLKLYQLISKTDAIKDADIRKKIKDKKFGAQLSINKHKLYTVMLDALREMHSTTSPYTQVISLIHQAHILYNKGLRKAMEEILLKAKAIARHYELRALELEILTVFQREQFTDSIKTVDEIRELTELMLEERKLNQLLNKSIMTEAVPGSRLSLQQNNSLKKLSDEASKNQSNSFTALFLRLRTTFTYHAIINDYFKSYELSLQIIDLFKQYPHMLQLELWRIQYAECLRNFTPSLNFFGKTELNEFVYKESKRLDVPEIYKQSILINMLDSHIQAGTFQESEKKVNDIQKHLLEYTQHLSSFNEVILFFNLAVLNFGMKKYSKALFWLNEIINSPDRYVNTSISTITRLVRLVVFYELGHIDILENNLRSTQRYLAKQEHQYQIDLLLLKCIRKIADVNDKQKLAEIMKETCITLTAYSKNKAESITLYYFDFISWCESKIKNQSFGEIIRTKNLERLKKLH